jgi:hypothetical protein
MVPMDRRSQSIRSLGERFAWMVPRPQQSKTDRMTNFGKAALSNAMKAVVVCFVIFCAQYGWDFAQGP